MIRRYLGLLALLAAVRVAGRAARLALTVLLVCAAAPVSVVAAAAVALAWRGGWRPAALYRAAAWCLPMAAVWLAATAVSAGSWQQVAAAPYLAWLAMWRETAAGSVALAAVTVAPPAIPLGLLAGGLAWSRRVFSMETGAGGLTPAAPAAFDRRQWRHQARSARARIAAPGAVPLVSRSGDVVAGAVIRAVGAPEQPLAALPYQRMRAHQVVIGTTGTGKTTLLLRLWAGFLAVGLRRHADGVCGRPLLVVLDCKGGADSRRIADRARRALRDAGARSTAIWPDEATLSLWALPPATLTTTLIDMIEHGEGAAAYYTDVMEAVVALAVGAPGGPPADSREFLARLDPAWLTAAYAAGRAEDAALLRSAARHIADIALRYRTLFRRLGDGLDGPGGFGDADVWYCVLEGATQVAVAEAQARALVDLLAWHAVGGPGAGREILLAVDEFSAVARRLPIWQLYERARSLGLAVQVSAQSWQGLAPAEDERRRIAATAEGGIWLLRTPDPEPAAALAGERPGVGTSRRLVGAPHWGREGSSQARQGPVVDPGIIRSLGVGQAAYLYRGSVTYVQVKRLVAAPAALGPQARAATQADLARQWPGADRDAHGARRDSHGAARDAHGADGALPGPGVTPPQAGALPPEAQALLDDAFGREPG